MDTIKYTFEDFERDMRSLVFQLDGKKYDLIVGINRGGCLPAVCLSHALKIPATMIDYSTRDGANINPKSLFGFFADLIDRFPNILIVDDLVDGGSSMKSLLPAAKACCNVEVATLMYNTDVDIDTRHYYGTAFSRKSEPRYFDFWWEMY